MQTAFDVLDVRGHTCPIPLLRAKRYLTAAASGQQVLVLSTDPDSKADFLAFCDGRASRLLKVEETNGTFSFLLEKC